MITFLKKENKKVRGGFKKIETDHKALLNTSAKILDNNDLLGDSFDNLNYHAHKVHSKNDDLTSTRSSEVKLNQDLRDRVGKVQDKYLQQAEARLELQRTMARILNLIQDSCKNGNVVEEAIVLALQCETEAKSEMVALEIATGEEPGLAGSDVSDNDSGTFGDSWVSR